jgi:predicted HTH domain antitoxin
MDLEKIQDFLVKLYTTKKFRDNFFASKEQQICGMHCDDEEQQILQQLEHEEVESLAISLLEKRFKKISNDALSYLERIERSVTESELRQLFYCYAENRPLKVKEKEPFYEFLEFVNSQWP